MFKDSAVGVTELFHIEVYVNKTLCHFFAVRLRLKWYLMIMNRTYARFDCRTCGETVYSPVDSEQSEAFVSTHKPLELTCSGGHTDQYHSNEVQIVDGKPDGKLRFKYAKAVGL